MLLVQSHTDVDPRVYESILGAVVYSCSSSMFSVNQDLYPNPLQYIWCRILFQAHLRDIAVYTFAVSREPVRKFVYDQQGFHCQCDHRFYIV